MSMYKREYISQGAMEHGANELLSGLCDTLGIDRGDSNFDTTPHRLAKALTELCHGSVMFEEQCEKALSTGFPNDKKYREMVFQDNIHCAGVCPHHLLPVEYTIHLAYIPHTEGTVVGLSKLARIADICASRPVLQETVTQDIMAQLQRLRPEGVGVYVKGRHGCMRVRGVLQPSSSTTTTAFSGVFMDNQATRSEFMGLVRESSL